MKTSESLYGDDTVAGQDDLNTPVIAVVGLLGAILLVVIIVFLMVIYYHVASQEEYVKNISQTPIELTDLVARQQADLVSYRWIDQNKGIVAIPISRAMDLVVDEYAGAGETLPSDTPIDNAKGAEK